MRVHLDHLIKMRSNEIESYKKTLKLSNFQKEVLAGTLLGDGCLETQNKGRTYRLKVEHSLTQKDYVNWKYEIFKDQLTGLEVAGFRPPEDTHFVTKAGHEFRTLSVSDVSSRVPLSQFLTQVSSIVEKETAIMAP